MKNKKFILIIMLILAAGMLWFHLHNSQITTSQSRDSATNAPVMAAVAVQTPANNPMPQAITNNSGVTNTLTDIATRYKQGLISKDAVVQESILAENEKPQDFYGKVIDQYGQPIAGVDVTGNLMLVQGWDSDEKIKRYKTSSDENGLFQFTGLKGSQLGVTVSKNGFVMNSHNESYKAPTSGQISPDNRVVLIMWKIRGPEPLIYSGIDAKIPHDGSATTFDIATGKESSTGDLRVTFSRFPLEVRRRDKFDWAVKIEMLHGGLVEENDPYPYWAPESGYQQSFEFNVSSNNIAAWYPSLEKAFYIKTTQGQYGKMQFGIYSSLTPARLKINFTINPSGSQNLEPDFSK